MASPGTTQPDPGAARNRPSWYSHYVLFVLVIVYIFNFIDRNILSILSQDIQADLGVSDAEMGFLYGTVFAVFLRRLWHTACSICRRLGAPQSDLHGFGVLERYDGPVGICALVSATRAL